MTDAQTWITVKDAMTLARRSKTVIYDWAKRGIVRSRRGERGALELHGLDVLKAEAKVKPGRPAGAGSPSATRRM